MFTEIVRVESHKTVLRLTAHLVRFPPAVRGMYNLLNRRVPPLEERAALAQSLFEHYKVICDLTRAFDLQFPRLIFGRLYTQDKDAPKDTGESVPNQAFIARQDLLCPMTETSVGSGICFMRAGKERVMDENVAQLYLEGPLRQTIALKPIGWNNVCERLCLYSGRRFEEIIYSQSSDLDEEMSGPASPQIPNTDSAKTLDIFGIRAPKDLSSVIAPVLTRDATGICSVYLGITKGQAPLK
jgi:hypothetical protein